MLEVLRLLAYSDAQPPFVRIFAAWPLACSTQFEAESGSEPAPRPAAAQTVVMQATDSACFRERVRCHGLIESLALAARVDSDTPRHLRMQLDAAVGEARAFNAKMRAAGNASTVMIC